MIRNQPSSFVIRNPEQHSRAIPTVTRLQNLVLLFLGSWAFSFGSPQGFAEELHRFEFSQPQMGVPFRMIIYARDEDNAKSAASAAFARIGVLNTSLSNYETDSELSQIGYQSGTSHWTPVSDDLFRIIQRAQKLSQVSEGAFDLTIGPLAASWRNARRTQSYPEPNQLERFRKRVGWYHLKLDHSQQKVSLRIPGMRLDPGGIAKGDALDQALDVLRKNGIQSALIAGAGDIAVSSPPPGRVAWKIQLSEFNTKSVDLPSFVHLEDQAIATSGDLYQFVELDGIRYSHIVDPQSGLGLSERRLVSVIAPRGITADSLATALSVIDQKKITQLLNAYPKVSARIVTMTDQGTDEQIFGSFRHYLSR